ncbi:hypothetical protein P4661_27565 [Priestia megaterium]|uniref:hypothetical protein n=1 Tax=Priestia megaterium TaxID=1404 RepID=UPI002E1B69C8|nr:hypothetical protein [Priestia megaterium]
MTVNTLTADHLEFVKRFVDGLEAYIMEETGSYFAMDYIDVLESGLRNEEIPYTESEKIAMIHYIQTSLEGEYGYNNVYYGSDQQDIPVDGQIKTVPCQLVVLLQKN